MESLPSCGVFAAVPCIDFSSANLANTIQGHPSSYIHSFIHSFIHPPVVIQTVTFIHPFINLFIHTFILQPWSSVIIQEVTFIYSLVPSFICPLIHSFIHIFYNNLPDYCDTGYPVYSHDVSAKVKCKIL